MEKIFLFKIENKLSIDGISFSCIEMQIITIYDFSNIKKKIN